MARILVADDDLAICEVLKELLEGERHDVVLAKDGQEAWRLIEGFVGVPFELLITDRQMPNMDGLELIRTVRQHPNSTINRMFTMLTSGNFTVELVRDALAARVDNIVPKPFDRNDLIAAINRLLGR